MRSFITVSFAILAAFFIPRFTEAVNCVPNTTTLCIDDQPGDGRFQVRVTFGTTQGGGQAGHGHAIPLASLGVTQGGVVWFFEADNPELLIKILPKCEVNGYYWVFASAGTNVGVVITITDLQTGAQRIYTNPDIHPMTPIQDVQAFPAALPCGNHVEDFSGTWRVNATKTSDTCGLPQTVLIDTLTVNQNGTALAASFPGPVLMSGTVNASGQFTLNQTNPQQGTSGTCTFMVGIAASGSFPNGTVTTALLRRQVSGSCPANTNCDAVFAGTLTRTSALQGETLEEQGVGESGNLAIDALSELLGR